MVAVVVQVLHQLLPALLHQLPRQRQVPDGRIRLLPQVQAALVSAIKSTVTGVCSIRGSGFSATARAFLSLFLILQSFVSRAALHATGLPE